MRYTLARFGRIVFERWHATPASGDLRAILDALALARKEAGEALIVIEVVSPAASPPGPATVREAIQGVRRLRYLRSLHLVVIEGDSVNRALVRGIFTPIAFVLGEPVTMCDTVEEAVTRACKVTGQDPARLLADLGAAGLLATA